MKRSIALAVILVLGGLPAGAGAVAHWASTAAAYPASEQVTTALTTGERDAQGLPGPAAKMAAPSLLAICGMSVNNPSPSPRAWLGLVNSEDISTVKLAQCYFNDPWTLSTAQHCTSMGSRGYLPRLVADGAWFSTRPAWHGSDPGNRNSLVQRAGPKRTRWPGVTVVS
jgi:hypothetical protein